jgi:hypothetical protein
LSFRGPGLAVLCVALVFPSMCSAQQGAMGGISSGVAAPAQYDAQKRPITAGGFVDSGPVVFQDITQQAGLSGWVHKMGVPEKKFIVETNGSGVGLIDYDNRRLALHLPGQRRNLRRARRQGPMPHAALFRNNHDGTFTDVAAKAGVTNDRWGYGVSIADYDNDGWPDIYVGNYGKNRLYRNNHDGTFTDVAEKAGVALGNWSPGSAWGDYDGDGLLDLYVTGYVHFDRDNLPIAGSEGRGLRLLPVPRRGGELRPARLEGRARPPLPQQRRRHVYRHTAKAGVEDKDNYYGFTPSLSRSTATASRTCWSATTPSPTFSTSTRATAPSTIRATVSGFRAQQGRPRDRVHGHRCRRLREQRPARLLRHRLSATTTRCSTATTATRALPTSATRPASPRPPSPFVGWGDGFLDYDNDGWLDLLMVNGHVYPAGGPARLGHHLCRAPAAVSQHPRWSGKGRKFEYMVPAVEGSGLADVIPARGAAFGDLFNDGKIDVVINNIDGPPVLLRNVNPDHHHWVSDSLVGGPKSPRDATCATVYLTANGMRQRQDVLASGSYISSNDRRLHFGLGDSTDAGTAEIHWPSGAIEKVRLPAQLCDRFFTITARARASPAPCAQGPPVALALSDRGELAVAVVEGQSATGGEQLASQP